jgi:hypothetical protein
MELHSVEVLSHVANKGRRVNLGEEESGKRGKPGSGEKSKPELLYFVR